MHLSKLRIRNTPVAAKEYDVVVFFDLGATLVKSPRKGPAKRIADCMGLTDRDAQHVEEIIFLQKIDNPRILYDKLKA